MTGNILAATDQGEKYSNISVDMMDEEAIKLVIRVCKPLRGGQRVNGN